MHHSHGVQIPNPLLTEHDISVQNSPRVYAIMAIAKAQGLELDLVQVDHIGESRKKLLEINPLGQIPVFVGPDGFVLSECIPIALYCREPS